MEDIRGEGSANGWRWLGYPGHFILGYRCHFHMATVIGGKYLVSTVGQLPDESGKGFREIGQGHLFETFVFECDGFDRYGNPRSSVQEIDSFHTSESVEAEIGHYDMCWKWQNILEEE